MCRIPRSKPRRRFFAKNSSRRKAVRPVRHAGVCRPVFLQLLRDSDDNALRPSFRLPPGLKDLQRNVPTSISCSIDPWYVKQARMMAQMKQSFTTKVKSCCNWLCKSSQFNSKKVASVSIVSILNLCSAKRMLWLYWSDQHHKSLAVAYPFTIIRPEMKRLTKRTTRFSTPESRKTRHAFRLEFL